MLNKACITCNRALHHPLQETRRLAKCEIKRLTMLVLDSGPRMPEYPLYPL